MKWKTRPTRGRVVYGKQYNAATGFRLPAERGTHHPSGRRYRPAGSGSWWLLRSLAVSLTHQ